MQQQDSFVDFRLTPIIDLGRMGHFGSLKGTEKRFLQSAWPVILSCVEEQALHSFSVAALCV